MNERQTKRQILLRFVRFRRPDGSDKGSIGRSTLTLLDSNWTDPVVWDRVRQWCLGVEGVTIGKATKTVTVTVLVTDEKAPDMSENIL